MIELRQTTMSPAKTVATCCLLLAAVWVGRTEGWDGGMNTGEDDVLQVFKSTLANFESDLRELLMAMSNVRDPYLNTKEVLEKYSDIMGYMQGSNPTDPIRSFKKAADGLPYAMKGYKHAVYSIKYSLYETIKVLAYFGSKDDLQHASFDEASKVKKVMAAFRNDFNAFYKAQFVVSKPVQKVKEAMYNLTNVCRDVDSAPMQLYETLFSLREASKRFGDSLAVFCEKHSDLWERLYEVQVALSKCDKVPALSNGTNAQTANQNTVGERGTDDEFLKWMMNVGAGAGQPAWDTKPKHDKQQKTDMDALFQQFADFLRWMMRRGSQNRRSPWEEMFNA